MPIERKVEGLIVALKVAKHRSPNGPINRQSHPLIARALELSKFPPDDLNEGDAAVAGSEILKGIEAYLRQEGVNGLRTAPEPAMTFYQKVGIILSNQ
ncbi:hypothetical protein HYW41_04240 [Candidatus Daviesbacteria bacterium]|nr:hypothetical protein [Candidatus Daviesbacteria bacterium]